MILAFASPTKAAAPDRAIASRPEVSNFGEGWRARVTYPVVPTATDDAECELWVESGWLHVRRRESTGIIWQVVLAKVQKQLVPEVTYVEGSPWIQVSYADGRYFIRDNSLVLRALRQQGDTKRPTFKVSDVVAGEKNMERFRGYTGAFGRFIEGAVYGDWFCAMTGPARGDWDLLVRLNQQELFDVPNNVMGGGTQGCTQMSDGLLGIYYGEKVVSDDGEIVVAHYNAPGFAQTQLNQKRIRDNLTEVRPPDITGSKWFNTEPLNWHNLRGKVVLIDFWATWCTPCVKKLPQVQQLADEFAADGLVVVGVHSRLAGDTCEAFTREQKI